MRRLTTIFVIAGILLGVMAVAILPNAQAHTVTKKQCLSSAQTRDRQYRYYRKCLTLAVDHAKQHLPKMPSLLIAIRNCESLTSGLYRANTGNGFYGAYQFTLGTWKSVGGAGYPHLATPAEQDKRALILFNKGNIRGSWPGCTSKLLG